MNKSRFLVPVFASALLFSGAVSADYYEYREELRKPGQTVEDAKSEQKAAYRKRMQEKYDHLEAARKDLNPLTQAQIDKIREIHKQRQREALTQRLGLTDPQRSKLEAMHEETRVFMEDMGSQIKAFHEAKKNEFRAILSDEQKEKLDRMTSLGWNKKESKLKHKETKD